MQDSSPATPQSLRLSRVLPAHTRQNTRRKPSVSSVFNTNQYLSIEINMFQHEIISYCHVPATSSSINLSVSAANCNINGHVSIENHTIQGCFLHHFCIFKRKLREKLAIYVAHQCKCCGGWFVRRLTGSRTIIIPWPVYLELQNIRPFVKGISQSPLHFQWKIQKQIGIYIAIRYRPGRPLSATTCRHCCFSNDTMM